MDLVDIKTKGQLNDEPATYQVSESEEISEGEDEEEHKVEEVFQLEGTGAGEDHLLEHRQRDSRRRHCRGCRGAALGS